MSCKKDVLYDNHHLIPIHDGGKNLPNNTVKIGRTCHAIFHFCNWQRTKNIKDYVAWKGLAGQISKQEMIKILSSEYGKNAVLNKLGIYGLSKEQRFLASSKGGKKAGHYMSKSMWINNGKVNKRVLVNSKIPEGFYKGKIKRAGKKRYTKDRDEYLTQFYDIISERLKDVKSLDLNKRGSIALLSKKWKVSHTQVRRFINKHCPSGVIGSHV